MCVYILLLVLGFTIGFFEYQIALNWLGISFIRVIYMPIRKIYMAINWLFHYDMIMNMEHKVMKKNDIT